MHVLKDLLLAISITFSSKHICCCKAVGYINSRLMSCMFQTYSILDFSIQPLARKQNLIYTAHLTPGQMRDVFNTTGMTWTKWSWSTAALTFTLLPLPLLLMVVWSIKGLKLMQKGLSIHASITKIESLLANWQKHIAWWAYCMMIAWLISIRSRQNIACSVQTCAYNVHPCWPISGKHMPRHD